MDRFHYLAMAALTVLAVPAALVLRRRPVSSTVTGAVAWLSLAAYIPIELAVISATTAPYDPMGQAVSVLGVTSCDPDPLPSVGAVVCSPAHLLMNWAFTLSGIAIAIGAICLRHWWPSGRGTTAITWLLAVAGLSYAATGVVPADVDLLWHTLLALPGMVVQIPAWIMLAALLAKARPWLAAWTGLAAAVHTAGLVGFAAAYAFDLPAGLFQRLMVWAVIVWAPVAVLLRAADRAEGSLYLSHQAAEDGRTMRTTITR